MKEPTNERRTINLWPAAGAQLGLSKNATYEAAERGDIPGAFRIGKRWLVSREAFEKFLSGGETPNRGAAA
jgi:excisionase family DNA binding protein